MHIITCKKKWSRRFMLLLVVCCYSLSLPLYGKDSKVDSLTIHVLLDKDGSARISETWTIDVGHDISEWYLVQSNLGNSRIKDFSVTDENGTLFIHDAEWTIDRSMKEKSGHCGIIQKGEDDYELCWGVGSAGKHSFTASYTMTHLIKSYNEADGFNQMFVARNLSAPPGKINLTMESRDTLLSSSTTKVWTFGYEGKINVVDGKIIAETTGKFSSEYCMIALVRFEKGLFNPTDTIHQDFEDVRKRAFEDSDYGKEQGATLDEFEYEWVGHIYLFLEPVFGDYTAFILLGLLVFLFYLIYRFFKQCFIYLNAYIALVFMKMKTNLRHKKRASAVNLPVSEWFRGIPCHGNLIKSNYIYNTQFFKIRDEYHYLIEAYIVRLIQHGVLGLTRRAVKEKGLQTFIQINSWKTIDENNPEDEKRLKGLYNIFKQAAGDDSLIQEKELKSWGKHHPLTLSGWYKELGISNFEFTATDQSELLGLRKYLKDFSLINERHIIEVKLWNEYLVYATLFGIADQVKKDFIKICPEYMDLLDTASRLAMNDESNQFIEQMAASTVRTAYFAHRITRRSRVNKSYTGSGRSHDRDSGYGGRSSLGGGEGYSGGGSGGGGR